MVGGFNPLAHWSDPLALVNFNPLGVTAISLARAWGVRTGYVTVISERMHHARCRGHFIHHQVNFLQLLYIFASFYHTSTVKGAKNTMHTMCVGILTSFGYSLKNNFSA